MHLLLTNDDGIDAPGLAALESAVAGFDFVQRVTVVAPDRGYSGCGHQVTNYSPLQVEETSPRHFKVFGTPADCTRLGLLQLASDVDVVLSGVNAGGNLGVDIYMSGTVAAIREAAWLGKPGIAISQYIRRDRERDWQKSAAMAARVFERLHPTVAAAASESVGGVCDAFWNVNLPDVDTPAEETELVDAFPEPKHLGVDFVEQGDGSYRVESDYRNRPRTVGSDVSHCFGGDISISRVPANP